MLRDFNFNLSKFSFNNDDEDDESSDNNSNVTIICDNFENKNNKITNGVRYRARGSNTSGNNVNILFQGSYANGTINILLAALMIFMVMIVVCCVLYLSHRNLKKRSSTRRRWLDSDANMEIYSVEQFFEDPPSTSDISETPRLLPPRNGPPPSYDDVVIENRPFLSIIRISSIKLNSNQNQYRDNTIINEELQCLTLNKTTTCETFEQNVSNSSEEIKNQHFVNVDMMCDSEQEQQPSTSQKFNSNQGDRTLSNINQATLRTNIEIDENKQNVLENFNSNQINRHHNNIEVVVMMDDSGLPTYDAAVQLEYRQNFTEQQQ